jgi:hypothetical protein
MVKIPLSLPASALETASAAAPAANDPASAISAAGPRIVDAYQAYDALRALTSQLNGLHDSDPIPDHVDINKITIAFQVNGKETTAVLRAVKRVGDLAPLLSQETDRLIALIRDQAARAREAAEVIEAVCSRAQYAVNAQRNGAS